MTGIHCLCSPEFFDALTDHKNVKNAYTYWQQGAVLINDMRAGFTYDGITFEEYRGQVTDMNGASRRFIAAGEAHCFPLGTVATFSTYFAPADFNETANTLGQPLRLGGLFNLTIMKPLATPRQMKDAVREAAERGRSNF